MSPEQGSEEAFKEEAERLYALNPSWHIQEAETELSSPQPSAAKLSHRKRFGKRIRKDHTVVDENLFFESVLKYHLSIHGQSIYVFSDR